MTKSEMIIFVTGIPFYMSLTGIQNEAISS